VLYGVGLANYHSSSTVKRLVVDIKNRG